MASKEEEPQQTWVLRVSIHCEGCKKKVKKILQKVSGVLAVEIDSKQKKVTVTGNVDADTLIRRLAKSGKPAEMWPEKKPANPNPSPSSNPTVKNKEKEQEATGEKEQPAAEKVAIKDKTPPDTISETPPKPAEKEKKPAETAAEPVEIETSKNNTKEEDKKPDKISESDSKPAEEPETSSKAGINGKKQAESSAAAPASPEGHVRNLPPHQLPPNQIAVYQHPVYAVSYNTAHPAATSHSYYAAMPPAPQSGMHSEYNHSSGGYTQQPPREYYPSENYYGSNYSVSPTQYSSQRDQNYYDSNYYASESYTGSMDPSPRASPAHPSQRGLDMFSDENANSCKIM